jgi:hypothetical protein
MLTVLSKIKLSKAEKIQVWDCIVKHGNTLNLTLNNNKQWE